MQINKYQTKPTNIIAVEVGVDNIFEIAGMLKAQIVEITFSEDNTAITNATYRTDVEKPLMQYGYLSVEPGGYIFKEAGEEENFYVYLSKKHFNEVYEKVNNA